MSQYSIRTYLGNFRFQKYMARLFREINPSLKGELSLNYEELSFIGCINVVIEIIER